MCLSVVGCWMGDDGVVVPWMGVAEVGLEMGVPSVVVVGHCTPSSGVLEGFLPSEHCHL